VRAVLQRVTRARVAVDGETIGEIGPGLLVLLGVGVGDTDADALSLIEKILNLRIFDDDNGKMNLSVMDIDGEMLIVSQFTLYADTRRGRRPSYIEAASPVDANRLYEFFVAEASRYLATVQTGRFQATMDVELVNNGPVTIILESHKIR